MNEYERDRAAAWHFHESLMRERDSYVAAPDDLIPFDPDAPITPREPYQTPEQYAEMCKVLDLLKSKYLSNH